MQIHFSDSIAVAQIRFPLANEHVIDVSLRMITPRTCCLGIQGSESMGTFRDLDPKEDRLERSEIDEKSGLLTLYILIRMCVLRKKIRNEAQINNRPAMNWGTPPPQMGVRWLRVAGTPEL